MKKLIPSLSLAICISVVSIAQDDGVDTYKPLKSDWGFSLNLTGLVSSMALGSMADSNGNQFFVVKHMLRDDLAFRAGFGITSWGNKWSSVDSVFIAGPSLVEWDSSFTRVDLFFAPGLEKHFAATSRLDPYMGAELKIGLLGKSTMKSNTITSTLDSTGGTVDVTGKMTGGSSIGVNLIAGFNYFFSNRISIGAEYSWGFNSSSVGGDWSIVTTSLPENASSSTTTREIGSARASTGGFAVGSTAGITLTWFFSQEKKEKKEKKPKVKAPEES